MAFIGVLLGIVFLLLLFAVRPARRERPRCEACGMELDREPPCDYCGQ